MTERLESLQARIRAGAVSSAVKILGADRRREAEFLAELLVQHFEKIAEAAAGIIVADTTLPDLPAILEDLVRQVREHSETLCETALSSVALVAVQSLAVAVTLYEPERADQLSRRQAAGPSNP